jgi:hypothetical protein
MDAQDREKQLSETRYAGELRGQFETLADSAGVAERRPRRRRLVIALVVGVGIAIVLGGVAAAGGFDQLRKTIWPTNEQGQTYGSAGLAKSPDDEPDLMAVASDGKKGYCYKTDLARPPLEALEGESAHDLNSAGARGYAIPKYQSDGTTQIGVFQIGGPGSGGGGSGDAGTYEMTADAHGTIITTRKAADGAITITREALDGSTTTNSAADDPSLLRLSEAERPVTWREITLWFRDVGPTHPELTSPEPVAPDWLVQRMSAAAREARDPAATAKWTLQFRRCAAPFDGAAALASEEVKYSLVWIAILHGDFTDWPSSAPASPAAGGYGWVYLLLDRDSHEVISEGASVTPFDTSLFRLQGRTELAGD